MTHHRYHQATSTPWHQRQCTTAKQCKANIGSSGSLTWQCGPVMRSIHLYQKLPRWICVPACAGRRLSWFRCLPPFPFLVPLFWFCLGCMTRALASESFLSCLFFLGSKASCCSLDLCGSFVSLNASCFWLQRGIANGVWRLSPYSFAVLSSERWLAHRRGGEMQRCYTNTPLFCWAGCGWR